VTRTLGRHSINSVFGIALMSQMGHEAKNSI
jgi:hypothetical protein